MSFAKCACIFDRESLNKIIELTLRLGKHLEIGIDGNRDADIDADIDHLTESTCYHGDRVFVVRLNKTCCWIYFIVMYM